MSEQGIQTNAATVPDVLAPGKAFGPLPRILRAIGTGVLVTAVSIFLLQGWESGNDVHRYLLLLAHTGLLAAIGLASGRWLREPKGARLFLALGIASLPVNFAIMGAFLYSQVGLAPADIAYPGAVTWQVADLSTALLTIAGALVILIPVAWVGFLALARRSSLHLSLLYLGLNFALLVPLRDPTSVGWLLAGLSLLTVTRLTRANRDDLSLRTPSGLFARAIQFLPLALLLARSLWLHSADLFLLTVMAGTTYLLLRQVALQFPGKARTRRILEHLAVVPAIAVALGVAGLVADGLHTVSGLSIPVFSLAFAALLVEVSLRSTLDGAAYRRLAAVVASGGILFNLLVFGGILAAFLCLVMGLVVLIYGHAVQQRSIFILGGASLLVGLVHQVGYAVDYYALGGWASLAVLGISVILAASVVERHGPQLKSRFTDWAGRFRSWEY